MEGKAEKGVVPQEFVPDLRLWWCRKIVKPGSNLWSRALLDGETDRQRERVRERERKSTSCTV